METTHRLSQKSLIGLELCQGLPTCEAMFESRLKDHVDAISVNVVIAGRHDQRATGEQFLQRVEEQRSRCRERSGGAVLRHVAR